VLNQEHAVSYEVNSVLYTLTLVSVELTHAKTLHLVNTFVTFLAYNLKVQHFPKSMF